MSIQETQARVRITACFQGEVRHKSLPLSLGRVLLKLPDSQTKIDLLLPDKPVHGSFQPLKFCVRKEEELQTQQLEGLRITADKANSFAMSVYVFKPGPKVGPKALRPDGSIWQQETVSRSEITVPVTRPAQIEPGAHYRLEISSQDGSSSQAHLVKIEGPIQKPTVMADDSQLFQTVHPFITEQLRQKVSESRNYAMTFQPSLQGITFNSFNEDLAKKSILTAINKLHSELRNELEEMCKTANNTTNIPLGQKACSRFLQALDRSDIGQLLQDQLKAAVGEKHYLNLLSCVYNAVYVPFVDNLKNQ